MHPNAGLIQNLYASLGRRDGDAMASCYRPDARFRDPAFGELRGDDVRHMWRMLTSRASEIEVDLVEHDADDSVGRAHWLARYPFAATGRRVENDVRSEFRFRDGAIAEQDDRFDLRRWAAQALGPAGRALGFTPLLSVIVQRRARAQLESFRSD